MLTAKQISFEYDNTVVLHDTTLSVSPGDRIGLIGSNGVGKSTLLKILAGKIDPIGGKILRSKDLKIGYLPQEITEYLLNTGQEFLEIATGAKPALEELDLATLEYSNVQNDETLKRYEEAYIAVDSLGAYTLNNRIAKALQKVGLNADVLLRKVSELSGGQKTKLALSGILLAQFDVFLLDEPTNNLDLDGLYVLEQFIHQSSASFVIISHDRRFLRRATTKIAELLSNKEIKLYTLGYDEYIDARRKQREAAEQRYSQFADEQKRLTEAARGRMFEAQAAANNKTASDSEKLGRNASKEKAARSHAKAASALTSRLEQLEVPDRPSKELDLNFRFKTTSDNVPSVIVDIKDVTITVGKNQLGPYSLKVMSAEKLVIVGPNGGGKSTFLKAVAGILPLSNGSIKLAGGVVVGYIDQEYSFPYPQASVISNLVKMTGLQQSELFNILARFDIKKDRAEVTPDELSPGQRSRALFAGLVAKGTNLLLLDEPTNHLDIPASDELQQALQHYQGSLVLVSHDRELISFLENKKVLVVENGHFLSEQASTKYVANVLKV